MLRSFRHFYRPLCIDDELKFNKKYNYDSSENVIESRFYISNQLYVIYTGSYDNKINPWHNLKNWLNYEATIIKNNLLGSSTIFVNNCSRILKQSILTLRVNSIEKFS